jgi:hypothetical protein
VNTNLLASIICPVTVFVVTSTISIGTVTTHDGRTFDWQAPEVVTRTNLHAEYGEGAAKQSWDITIGSSSIVLTNQGWLAQSTVEKSTNTPVRIPPLPLLPKRE